MSEKQRTIQKSASLKGTGLHTGAEVTLTLNPAPVNSGFSFKRTDLENTPVIRALADNVVFTERGTVLEENNARVSTIEHCLAALRGMGIDNCLIEVDGPEAPILDGSAHFFVQAIKEAGISEQEAEREYFIVKEKMIVEDPETGSSVIAIPDDGQNYQAMISFNNSMLLSNQYANMEGMEQFESEISNCRTFVFLHELEPLLKNNLIKGGDLDNAIIIIDKEVPQEELDRLAALFNKPSVEVKPIGILNNLDLHHPNEPARHKLLDVIGDLTLAGMPIKGRIIANKPGHKINAEFAKAVRKEIKRRQLKADAPEYDPNAEPVFDINEIKKLLPHRPPFLLVDKIIDLKDKTIVGVKNVTMNEPFFVGHFPEEPVMPGVLQVEAMAQIGGILVLSQVDDPKQYSTYFLKIDNIKFRKKVVPGDTIVFKLELMTEIRRGVANMKGTAFVGDNIVAEGEFMAQIVKNK
ncbi:3-hydroxyacyl-[acyl-carrier-protein] dehydratase /UDP-3-O-[3-hydroxymyristoyl] N-acetylglucosamine deacetylase [Marinilabilia salmonicolor]|jgi:UDP-3-O-[3-hydroxymyristoyl] N-acetylglucosamine deacetylase/3-hydroxyacyl-[acyl-carrier-protein] dehydratase|uniref:bifunctional UDP-3-O-[3-hydroxymyristoyl] N-acetylglucosamine deacetylase/3-hydroxyacyl-ACP dehydratase n=1 Tax=Marinilabilia salmonicolor TaxID=989 RepID=UPI000D064B87|nr:bifunctional UDP-3-O-[3-hydroxymyristoyl] N-acetylglucosamine deacetylase/3-hydroxyacyl-ACP dehydratase [Marinilabilia salmonicolor]PRY99801.1 3-hydroxyacyl-[acyl-carrier-protein] dehydratase /UDP-3-O-[3-hydroxymyristoyl] N-acetylglucosamine deacetylase [Marinilabilia salmonicolor]